MFAPKTMFQLSSENMNEDNYNIVDRPASNVTHMLYLLQKDMTEVMNRQGEESKPCVVFFDDYDSEPAVLIRSEMKKWANACKVTLFIEIRDF